MQKNNKGNFIDDERISSIHVSINKCVYRDDEAIISEIESVSIKFNVF